MEKKYDFTAIEKNGRNTGRKTIPSMPKITAINPNITLLWNFLILRDRGFT